MFVQDSLNINEKGRLTFGGVDTVELARKFGTPAYVMDDAVIRRNCRTYLSALKKYCRPGSLPLYASKALSFTGIYRIMAEEGMGCDVVSPGELYTAKKADFPMDKIYFHGNNKTDSDIRMGIEYGVGTFICDNNEELEAISRIAGEFGKTQRIFLRITPGIDPHTHRKIITGNVDSKFGTAIATGQAMEIVKKALAAPNVSLQGLHCHIGSQIFESDPFDDAAAIMIRFIAEIKRETGRELANLNLGGGFGVRYIEEHKGIDFDRGVREVSEAIKKACAENGVTEPAIMLEPGRSIVADAGITLYTVGSVKQITGFKNYISIDGGMPDNPRYALYQSEYDAVIADRAGEAKTFKCTIAGRCCESGDLIAENLYMQPANRGDILAVFVTGAYNYSMASNYNRIPRPPVIMLRGGEPYTAVRRESFEDLVRNDV